MSETEVTHAHPTGELSPLTIAERFIEALSTINLRKMSPGPNRLLTQAANDILQTGYSFESKLTALALVLNIAHRCKRSIFAAHPVSIDLSMPDVEREIRPTQEHSFLQRLVALKQRERGNHKDPCLISALTLNSTEGVEILQLLIDAGILEVVCTHELRIVNETFARAIFAETDAIRSGLRGAAFPQRGKLFVAALGLPIDDEHGIYTLLQGRGTSEHPVDDAELIRCIVEFLPDSRAAKYIGILKTSGKLDLEYRGDALSAPMLTDIIETAAALHPGRAPDLMDITLSWLLKSGYSRLRQLPNTPNIVLRDWLRKGLSSAVSQDRSIIATTDLLTHEPVAKVITNLFAHLVGKEISIPEISERMEGQRGRHITFFGTESRFSLSDSSASLIWGLMGPYFRCSPDIHHDISPAALIVEFLKLGQPRNEPSPAYAMLKKAITELL